MRTLCTWLLLVTASGFGSVTRPVSTDGWLRLPVSGRQWAQPPASSNGAADLVARELEENEEEVDQESAWHGWSWVSLTSSSHFLVELFCSPLANPLCQDSRGRAPPC